ncbi:tRNA epoxyqueuosine(34) reductase QueG [Xylanibacter muris]|uniref:tRNA epoxyqueuosine(34) reductase QueG n=1 Tax=Xylanibacter muris TaxID=2736290 RepID=A0ABX2AQC6_9BACT|nr:tRNA epoxyqueuosine(34) reductase QueG [Xylanibacter muris]NPD92141.1 tRNA epoxyqueuosine(34) reductase QueG [Xylanibacter muris]
MTDKETLTSNIKAEAANLGFFACGIAHAEPVDRQTADKFMKWIELKGHASMAYMANHTDKRLNPTLLMPEAKSIICVAMNYTPHEMMDIKEYRLAAYAYGKDYHDIMKDKLRKLATTIPSDNIKICCDTAPILEKYWAMKAGIGWIGKNHLLTIPHAGNMFFLGEIITDIEMIYDSPGTNRCGTCRACLDACPTKALHDCDEKRIGNDNAENIFRAETCLSYQTIENRGALSEKAERGMGNYIYGCDRCLTACPWNTFAKPCTEPRLQPSHELMNMKKAQWHDLSVDRYRRLFKGSAVKRAKYDGLMRNIIAVKNRQE